MVRFPTICGSLSASLSACSSLRESVIISSAIFSISVLSFLPDICEKIANDSLSVSAIDCLDSLYRLLTIIVSSWQKVKANQHEKKIRLIGATNVHPGIDGKSHREPALVVGDVDKVPDARKVEDDAHAGDEFEGLNNVRHKGGKQFPEAIQLHHGAHKGPSEQDKQEAEEEGARGHFLLLPEEKSHRFLKSQQKCKTNHKREIAQRQQRSLEQQHDAQEHTHAADEAKSDPDLLVVLN